MGCTGSKSSQDLPENKREADRWQRRKKNGFRDSGLERTRQACVKQKKELNRVEDPDRARKEKINRIQNKQTKENTPSGMATNSELQRARKNLKPRR